MNEFQTDLTLMHFVDEGGIHYLNIDYQNGKHRYLPKLSQDGKSWTDLDSNLITKQGDNVQFPLNVKGDTLWVAGQALFTTEHSG